MFSWCPCGLSLGTWLPLTVQIHYMHLDYRIQHIKSKEDYIIFCFTE